MSRVICPFCFKIHDFDTSLRCPGSSEEVPARYVTDYSRVAPLWLTTIGFPGHGKTTYLASLTLVLEELSSLVEGMWYRPLDGYSFQAVRRMRDEVDLGKTAKRTPPGTLRPLFFQVHGLPSFEPRCLVLYDVAGESYDAFEKVDELAPAMKQVNTAWLLVSLRDLANRGGRTLTDLFNVYLSGMEKLRVAVDGWNLIVVFTKADQEHFTPEIKSYLKDDPLLALWQVGPRDQPPPFDLPGYLEKMREVSELLESFTRGCVRGGSGFVNMVRATGMNLVFSLASALGQSPDPERGGLRQGAVPHRVLDALLWALALERPQPVRTLRLVLDPPAAESEAYRDIVLGDLWSRLSDYGEVITHYLGRAQPASGPGQRPTEPNGERPAPRLVGPILEGSLPDDRILVVTTAAIEDLADFRNTRWQDRLLLVTLGGDSPHRWPHRIAHSGGEAPTATWVERLLTI